MSKSVSEILAPVAEIATAIFAPEVAGALGLTDLLGTTAGTAAVEAAGGALGGGLSTGSVKGALGGAALGGVGGELGGLVGGDVGSAISGAALGAAGSGFSPLGAAAGGALGGISSALQGGPLIGAAPTTTAAGAPITAPTAGSGVGAVGLSAPTSVPLGGGGDVTLGTSTDLPTALGGNIGSTTTASPGTSVPSLLSSSGVPGTEGATPFGQSLTAGAGQAQSAINSLTPASSGPFTNTFNPPANPTFAQLNTTANAADSSGGILSALGKNANLLVPAAGLAANLLLGQQKPAGLSNIQGIANAEQAQGAQLESYLQSGTLPPGVQAGLNQAGQAAKASIRSLYASKGMSGSSAEQQDLANVDVTMTTQGSQIALSLLNQGVSETGLASQLYTTIMNQALAQDQLLSNSIGAFSAAAAGGGGNSITLKAA